MNKKLAQQYFYLYFYLPQILPQENRRAGSVQLIYMLTLSMKKNELGSGLKGNPFRENLYELCLKKSIDTDAGWVLAAGGHTGFPQ